MKQGHVVAWQGEDGKLQVVDDVDVTDAVAIIGKADGGFGERLARAEKRIEAVSSDMPSDPDLAVEYFQVQQSLVARDELLSADLATYQGDEVVARVEQYHRYTDVGSALLYRDANFRGGSKFFTVTWPNFKWSPYCFNDAASSAKAWGVNILFQDTWYRGRRLYLVGLPYAEFPDLGVFDFNDRASSFVSVP